MAFTCVFEFLLYMSRDNIDLFIVALLFDENVYLLICFNQENCTWRMVLSVTVVCQFGNKYDSTTKKSDDRINGRRS